MLKSCAGHLYLAVHTLSALLKNTPSPLSRLWKRHHCFGSIAPLGTCAYVSKHTFPSLPNKKLETNASFYQ